MLEKAGMAAALPPGPPLRRPPRPPLPPSAHDVLREARLLRALADTPARVPKVLAVGADETTIGAPFYVMEYIARQMTRWSRQYRADLAWSQANGGSMRSRAASDST